MKLLNGLKIGVIGVLGAVGCDGNINHPSPHDKSEIVQSANYNLDVPNLIDLERKVSAFSTEVGYKENLLGQADYGSRFHNSVSLFVGNYTLGESNWFSYNLEHETEVDSLMVEKLRSDAEAIRHNGEENSDDTLKRCSAAEELYGIMKKAETEKHLDEAAKVIGYLDWASAKKQSVFSSFEFFYENDYDNEEPNKILSRYFNHVAVDIGRMSERASIGLDSLSNEVKDELVMWIGRYGHDALQGMTATTILFKDNQPDRVTTARVLPDIPAAPTIGEDTFYRSFGKDLLKGYGLYGLDKMTFFHFGLGL